MARLLSLFVLFLVISKDLCSSSTTDDPPVVALILARGGSKGIPLKNLSEISGKSLLSRALKTIHSSSVFHQVWVSTDHPLIAEEAEKSNASVFQRSEELARDETASIDSVKEFLKAHPKIQKIALIQCTSPLIIPEYLQSAYEKFQSHECVFSVRHSHEFRWKRSKGVVSPINLDPLKRPRRQDWDGEFVENGMFYMTTRDLIMNRHSFQSKGCEIILVPSEDSLQIDTPGDLAIAELVLQQRQGKSKSPPLP